MSQTGLSETREFFRKSYGSVPAHIVQAPGRLELLGNHTDYNGGLVMSLAVDKYVYFAASPRKDAQVELVSTSFPQRETFYLDKIEKNPQTSWANYVKGVLVELRRRGVHFTGFNGAIHGTIPFGAGMSSSAALEIASALIIRELFPYTLTETGIDAPPQREEAHLPKLRPAEKLLIAKVGQAAESKFVGVNSGLLDQISSLFGKEAQVMEIDFLHNAVEHEPLPHDVAVVVCDSGVKHDLSAGEYNELRSYCEAAARKLGVQFLRFITPDQLEQNKSKLTDREYQCAFHVVGENQRVVFGARALREGDINQFGQYLFQSHASSRDFFKNSTVELDTLVEIAQQLPGCYGARLTGGGFGGATINLVQRDQAKAFADSLAREYEKRRGIKSSPFSCQVVDGAH
jgi:galactokinase